jgi:uncharacterized protein (TIGR02270 family)
LDGTFAPVTAVLSTKGPEHSAALCRLKAFRRTVPGRELMEAFESNVPSLQVEALRAVCYAPEESAARYVSAGLRSESPAVRRAAVESGVRRRLPDAWEMAVRVAHERHPESGAFLPLLAMLGSAHEHEIVISALRETSLQPQALFALGYLGTPEAVEICLAGMRDSKLARIAGEVYCAITGADLERDQLAAGEAPDGESPPPFEADALDADLIPAAHDLWPLPDVDAIRRHWESAKSHYSSGVRHIRGRPFDLSGLIGAIETGPMLRRPDMIVEAVVRTAGQYDVEPRAFVHIQRRMMAAGRGGSSPRAPR